jgi:adenylate cyclase
VERKLTTIMAADVVGYSRLMEQDEAGTFDRIRAHRTELFEPEVAKHHGRIFKFMGDGLLVEFGSVVDAVECAVALQRGLAERNAHVPNNRRIEMRIGINLGEVIVDGDDRFGEGVNIAARLEQIAEPGTILVSSKIANEVEKKLAFGFEPMGQQKVKNIAQPITVFKVKLDDMPVRTRPVRHPSRRGMLVALAIALSFVLAVGFAAWQWFPTSTTPLAPALGRKPSLVVLPFASLSDDKEQSYIADGLTEDLTTELARIPDVLVMSRNAAFTYKGRATPPAQIAKELGVKYILEGSIRRAGNDLRINAQLIDTTSGTHMWAERFDGDWSRVFELQDRLVAQIATSLKLRLVDAERSSQITGGTSNPSAYEAYLRGRELERRDRPDDWAKAVSYLKEALERDPNFGAAAAELAYVYKNANWLPSRAAAIGVSQYKAMGQANTYLTKAAQNPSATYYVIASENLLYQQKSDEAVVAAQRAIALDSSDEDSYTQMSAALIYNGRPEDALGFLELAARIAPNSSRWRDVLIGLAYFSMDRFKDAAAALEKVDRQSDYDGFYDIWAPIYALKLLIPTYGYLGRNDDIVVAKERIKPYLAEAEDGEYTGLLMIEYFPFKKAADRERMLEGLRKAGVPELPFGFDAKSKDRLSGSAIKDLLFGHEIQGRRLPLESPTAGRSGQAVSAGQPGVDSEVYIRATSLEGATRITLGSWSDNNALSDVEGDSVCTFFPTLGRRLCAAVFRNPSGSFAQKNEYHLLFPWRRFDVSVVN